MTLSSITSRPYPHFQQSFGAKKISEPEQQVYDEFGWPAICLRIDDAQVDDREHAYGEETPLSPLSAIPHAGSYTSYGACAAKVEERNHSILIEDVRILWSLFRKAKIISPSSKVSPFNAEIKLLAEIINRLGADKAQVINVVKTLEEEERILAQQKNSLGYTYTEDRYKKIASSPEVISLVRKAIDKLDEEMKQDAKRAAEQGFVKYRYFPLFAAFCNSGYNLYCSVRNITTSGPAFISLLITTSTFFGTLLFSAENTIPKQLKSHLKKIQKEQKSIEKDLQLKKMNGEIAIINQGLISQKEATLSQDKERKNRNRHSWSGSSSGVSMTAYSGKVRSRQNSTQSDISDISAITVYGSQQDLSKLDYFNYV